MLYIPQQTVKTQALEYFDINEYGRLWNPDWQLESASRGGFGATYLYGDVLVTFPRGRIEVSPSANKMAFQARPSGELRAPKG
jgi:hypothetical protein